MAVPSGRLTDAFDMMELPKKRPADIPLRARPMRRETAVAETKRSRPRETLPLARARAPHPSPESRELRL
jgi:hypothetical protein